ncbi:MAG: FmdB family transcriptional regulator [Chloroflexota bacterium]|nr:FmdB family transcriptional regulator [Chloroflexota bacterium]
MPIYDYHCDHCGHTFSQVQSYTDATLEKCPSCGKRPRKLMATPAIVFKGGGWYKTDSRPAQKDGGGTGDTKPEGKAETRSDAKAESKTDTSEGKTKDAPPANAEARKADAPLPAAPKGDAASS